MIGWNTLEQRLQVTVQGGSTLLSQTVILNAAGNGVTRWVSKSFSFTADSSSTVLKFQDISQVTLNLDLLLDHVRVTEEGSQAPSFANGGFESGADGWTLNGYVRAIRGSARLPAAEGTQMVIFNDGDMPPNGVLARTFATAIGRNYAMTFSAGVISYNSSVQRMQIQVQGSSPLVSQTISLTGSGNGTLKWVPQRYAFVANSVTTTLTFRDVSSTSFSLDMLLDDVRISTLD